MLESCREHLSSLSMEELHRAFFLATTMGETREPTDATDEPFSDFEAYIDAQEHSSKTIIETLDKSDPDRYACRLDVMINHRLFITYSGRIGLGPGRIAPQDIIVILFGGNVPYVLRSYSNG
jgi:hypothetical protein